MNRYLALLTLPWLVACIDLGSPAPNAPAGTISGAIIYDGSTERALVVEAWDSMPPAGPPLATATVDAPVFPQDYTLTGLDPGAIFLTARLADADSAPAVLGSYPSLDEVSAVRLEETAGLSAADFEIVPDGAHADPTVVLGDTRMLAGAIHYEGTLGPADMLRGALYLRYPAHGAPADLQILNIRTPTFPFEYRFTHVRDGAYFTVFYIDRGGNSPFGPGREDTVAWALAPSGRPVATPIALGASRAGVDIRF